MKVMKNVGEGELNPLRGPLAALAAHIEWYLPGDSATSDKLAGAVHKKLYISVGVVLSR